MKSLSLLIGLVAAGVAATGRAAALPATSIVAPPLSPRVVFRDLGRAPANYPVSIVVTLPYRHAAQLQRLIEAQGDPDSSSYRRFLTPAQFAAIFGPTPQDEAAIVQLLRREDFTITHRFSNRTIVDAVAPAAVAERYFHTEIHLALQGRSVRYFNARVAIVPAELSARAFTVIGLSNLETTSPRSSQAPNGMRADKSGLGKPLENEGGFGPLGFARGYDLPVQHGYTGKGVTVAEIENTEPVPSGYIPEFSWAFDFPLPTGSTGAATKLERVDGGCSSSSNCAGASGAGTDVLDYAEYQEYLAALAPGITAYLYQIPDDTTSSWTDGFNQVVSDNHADIVALGTIFHFENETNSESFALALDHVIQQGNALGTTFISPSNSIIDDSGGNFGDIPGDSPNVLSVGSSNIQLNASGVRHSEASCEEGFSVPSKSIFFPEPSYKAGIPGVSTTGRDQPDLVAAEWIEQSTAPGIPLWQLNGGFSVYVGGGSWTLGGASPSPIVAIVADIDQMNHGRAGLINSAIFRVFKKEQYGSAKAPLFHDITQVTPGGASGASFYRPAKGYDWPTGIGSVDGWNLAQAVRKKK